MLIHSHITLDQTDGIQELGTAQKSTLLSGVYHISGQQVRGAAHATVEETLQSLPAGIYVLTEVTAPEGYEETESITFRVINSRRIQKVEM